MSGFKILCDLDGIVVNLLGPWLDWYNKIYGDCLSPDDIKTWDIDLCAKHGHAIYNFLQLPEIYRSLPPIPGALAGFKKLQEKHDMIVVTASAKNPQTSTDKLIWIKEHLGLGRKDVIIAHRKYLVAGDILIDDSPLNLHDFSSQWGPCARTITLDYAYNRNVKVSFRASTWPQIVDQIGQWEIVAPGRGW